MPDLRPAVDTLPLGSAPRPTTAPDLLARLRPAVVEALGPDVDGLERVRLDAALDGPDVTRLEVDLTGVRVRVAGSRGAGAVGRDPSGQRSHTVDAVHSREDATLHRLRVDAHPLTVEDVPVDVVAEVDGLRFRWVEGTDGSLAVEAVEPSDDAPLGGHVRVAAPRDAVLATARRLVATELEGVGLSLVSLDVDLVSDGPRSVSVRGFARVRKGILSASVRATATAEVDSRMVLTVRDVGLSSRNPVVAGLLLAARGEVAKADGQSIDLAAELPDGIRLADVRVEVGATLAVAARFA
jgi:hypothetical protein